MLAQIFVVALLAAAFFCEAQAAWLWSRKKPSAYYYYTSPDAKYRPGAAPAAPEAAIRHAWNPPELPPITPLEPLDPVAMLADMQGERRRRNVATDSLRRVSKPSQTYAERHDKLFNGAREDETYFPQ